MNGPTSQRRELSRRVFLAGSLAAGAALAACGKSGAPTATLETQPMSTPTSLDAAIKAGKYPEAGSIADQILKLIDQPG
jgi:hypothetical protein